MARTITALLGAILLVLPIPSFAEDAPLAEQLEQEAHATDQLAANRDSAIADALVEDFTAWAGSPDNARSLVDGLHDAKVIQLSTRAEGEANIARIGSPGKPMGFGDVIIALTLIQQELKRAGVAKPNANQMRAAMTGDKITVGEKTVVVHGVLAMRAGNAGWGVIAEAMGLDLGPVLDRLRSENARLAAGARGKAVGADETGAPPVKAEKLDRPEGAAGY